jgi:hypothetical protein
MELLNEEPWYKCKVTFGPDQGQYCVVCENGRTRWNVDMPDECTYDVRKINMVALGLGGAYVVLYANGEILWACETNYPDLYKILIGSDRGDVVVCFHLHFMYSNVACMMQDANIPFGAVCGNESAP